MKRVFLNFEQPIAALVNQIEELRQVQDEPVIDISEEIERLQRKVDEITKKIYVGLTPVEI